MLFSLFPGSVFASDSSLTELLEKLQNLVTEETTEDVPSDSDHTVTLLIRIAP